MDRNIKYEYVDLQECTSFKYSSYKVAIDDVISLHQHKEWEISIIHRGSGTVITGNSAEIFSIGSITIIPPMVPHCWIFTRSGRTENDMTESSTIHFEDSLIENIGAFKEFEHVGQTIKRIDKAFTLHNDDAADIAKIMSSIKNQDNHERLFSLIKILCACASRVEDKDFMNGKISTLNAEDDERIGRVIKYVTKNYMRKITLDEIANVAIMSKTRFCAYFKQSLKQTFFTFLNRYRVEIAASMLIERRTSVSNICYEVGFNDIPHFFRTFKKYKGCSPKTYLRTISV